MTNMNWIIKIENKPNLRLNIEYQPSTLELILNGEYKLKTGVWTNMCSINSTCNIDLEKLQELLYETYENLNERVEKLDELNKTFKFIREIEINE